MPRRALPIATMLLLALVSGCAPSLPRRPRDLAHDPEVLALARGGPPLVFTVAVAPPVVGGSSPLAVTASADRAVSARKVDRAGWQSSLAAGLRATGLFRSVETLRPAELGSDVGEQRRRLAMFARELRANFVLVPRVEKDEVAFLGMNGWWAPSAALCATLWWPTFWFPDEDYAASVEIECELVDARTEKVVWGPRAFAGRAEGSFDDFERGWDLLGPWGIPLFPKSGLLGIDESNWRAVERTLVPVALVRAEKSFLQDICAYLRRAPIRIEAAEPQSLALVVGVDGVRGAPALAGAEADARALSRLLLDPKVGAVPQQNLKLLLGDDASRAQILDFLTGDLARTAPADQVVIAFAGYGALQRGAGMRTGEAAERAYLIAADTDLASPSRTAVSLDDIAGALDRAPARRILVYLDCSFGGDVAGRTLGAARLDAAPAASPRAFLERLCARPGRFVLAACEPGETAQEYAAEGRGIYTLLFEQGISELSRQGTRVTLRDLAGWLEEHVPPTSALLGQRQDPLLLGDRDAAGAVIIADRKRQ